MKSYKNPYAGMTATGYSWQISNPEFLEQAAKRINKQARIWIILVLVFASFSALMFILPDAPKAAGIIVLVIAAALIAVVLIWRAGTVRNIGTGYKDGEVVSDKSREVEVEGSGGFTDHTIKIEFQDGSRKTIRNIDDFYGSFRRGEKVRYHPHLPYKLERLDKSRRVDCLLCGKGNSPGRDKCSFCGAILLK